MAGFILTINAGSSSIKFSVWNASHSNIEEVFRGEIEEIEIAPRLLARKPSGEMLIVRAFDDGSAKLSHEDLLGALFTDLLELYRNEIAAIGHRVVHGGGAFVTPVRVDDKVLAALADLEVLAPLHQPHNVLAIRACAGLLPHIPQVACFDTAFHHTMPAVARRLGLPRTYEDEGVRRYGFHGYRAPPARS
jgi:acetate kinase